MLTCSAAPLVDSCLGPSPSLLPLSCGPSSSESPACLQRCRKLQREIDALNKVAQCHSLWPLPSLLPCSSGPCSSESSGCLQRTGPQKSEAHDVNKVIGSGILQVGLIAMVATAAAAPPHPSHLPAHMHPLACIHDVEQPHACTRISLLHRLACVRCRHLQSMSPPRRNPERPWHPKPFSSAPSGGGHVGVIVFAHFQVVVGSVVLVLPVLPLRWKEAHRHMLHAVTRSGAWQLPLQCTFGVLHSNCAQLHPTCCC